MSFLPPICAAAAILLGGLGLVRLAAPELRRTPSGRVLGGIMALLFGTALWSGLYSASLFGSFCDARSRLAKDAGLAVLGGLALAWGARRSRTTPGATSATRAEGGRVPWPLVALLAVAVPLATLEYLGSLANEPEGSWDAWAIWNLRARFLARAGADYAVGLKESDAISHADYPLLLPGAVAQWWLALGSEGIGVPAAIATIFTAAAVALPALALAILRGPAVGIAAALAILGIPFFLVAGSSQCADLPLAAYVALAAVAVAFGVDGPPPRDGAWFALAGLACSAAAYTKNEGQLFLLAFAAALALRAATARSLRAAAALAWFALGAAPLFALGCYMKKAFDLHNDLFLDFHLDRALFNKLTNIKNYFYIIQQFIFMLNNIAKWGLTPFALPVVVLAFSRPRRDLRRSAAPVLALALGTVALGFFVIYLITPHDLHWHVTSSMDRLTVQMIPATVFASLLAVGGRAPGSVIPLAAYVALAAVAVAFGVDGPPPRDGAWFALAGLACSAAA